MRYSKDHKEETRNNIVEAALKTFRVSGYNGIGVDGIAKEAGVTSGAFYKSFGSKAEAFQVAMSEGLGILRDAIADAQKTQGNRWFTTFTKWYFSFRAPGAKAASSHPLPMEGGCALPTLSPEIARTDAETKQLFEEEILRIVEVLSAGLPNRGLKRKRIAWSTLSLMIGGVVLARSVYNKETAAEIAKSIVLSLSDLNENS